MLAPHVQIAFVLRSLAVPSPAQQLLDRFLLGYPHEGQFYRPPCQVAAWAASPEVAALLESRSTGLGLELHSSLPKVLGSAQAAIIDGDTPDLPPDSALIRKTLEYLPRGGACFVCGPLAGKVSTAKALSQLAHYRNLTLTAGTPLGLTWQLPPLSLKPNSELSGALAVVQGPFPWAELDALEFVLPLVERRRGGETGISRVEFVEGDALWQAGRENRWSWSLLTAAISRSDSPQGDPVADGRTQDLAGLGLLPKLARDPRAWLLEHRDGLRTTLLVLDGVVNDYNVALQTVSGRVLSSQIYRAPKPAQHEYSILAHALQLHFRGDPPPCPPGRALLMARLIEEFSK